MDWVVISQRSECRSVRIENASHDRGPTSTSANDQALWRQFFLMLLREEDGYAAKCKRVGL